MVRYPCARSNANPGNATPSAATRSRTKFRSSISGPSACTRSSRGTTTSPRARSVKYPSTRATGRCGVPVTTASRSAVPASVSFFTNGRSGFRSPRYRTRRSSMSAPARPFASTDAPSRTTRALSAVQTRRRRADASVGALEDEPVEIAGVEARLDGETPLEVHDDRRSTAWASPLSVPGTVRAGSIGSASSRTFLEPSLDFESALVQGDDDHHVLDGDIPVAGGHAGETEHVVAHFPFAADRFHRPRPPAPRPVPVERDDVAAAGHGSADAIDEPGTQIGAAEQPPQQRQRQALARDVELEGARARRSRPRCSGDPGPRSADVLETHALRRRARGGDRDLRAGEIDRTEAIGEHSGEPSRDRSGSRRPPPAPRPGRSSESIFTVRHGRTISAVPPTASKRPMPNRGRRAADPGLRDARNPGSA